MTGQPGAKGCRGRTRGGGVPRREGIIAGAVLRAIRESLSLSQEQLASELRVDANTVQSWETGRRGLPSTRVSTLVSLRTELSRLGARPRPPMTLAPALDADAILRYVVDFPSMHSAEQLRRHPLAHTVLRRDVVEALGWAFTGRPPAGLTGASLAPALPADDRMRFFEHMRSATQLSQRLHQGATDLQPHRQFYYLLTWARDEETA